MAASRKPGRIDTDGRLKWDEDTEESGPWWVELIDKIARTLLFLLLLLHC